MPTKFYIDPVERARIVTKWVKISLFFLHLWATAALFAGLLGTDKELTIAVFKTCTFGIGATLIILLLDRAGDVLLNKFSTASVPMATTQTVTTETKPALPANPVEAGNVNIKAENVNVGQSES